VLLGRSADLDVPERLVNALRSAFTHQNPDYGVRRDAAPTLRTWRNQNDQRGQWLTVPRGGMQRVREVLRSLGYGWRVEDARTTGDPALAGCIPQLRFPLWDYQEEAVQAAIAKQNCLVRAPTGSGKTTAAFAIASRLNLGTLIALDDGGLFKQWTRRCCDELGMRDEHVGRVKGPVKSWRIGPITIASTATLYQHPEFFELHGDKFGLVIADEVQGFAAKTMFASIDPLRARYRVGVSADESRKDRKEFLVYDLFGDVAADISQERVIASGNVLDVTIRVVPTEFRADWYRSTMQRRDITTARKQQAFNTLINEMCGDEARNVLVATLVQQQAKLGHRVMVWSHRVEHCRLLDNMLAGYGVMSGLMLGGAQQSAEFERTRGGLTTGMLDAGIGTFEAIGQAIDIPLASRGVITTPVATNRQRFNQVKGRLCRTAKDRGKVDAEAFYLWDRLVQGNLPVQNLHKWFGRVLVQDGNEWLKVPAYLARHRGQRHPADSDDLDGVFA
jgi:superfamily II DNA or RNA helicase